MEEKVKSIQFRLFIMLCISIMLVIFIIVVVNNVVLKHFINIRKRKLQRKFMKKLTITTMELFNMT